MYAYQPIPGGDDMKAITRRLNRIEHQLTPPAPKPRTWFRVVIRMEDPDAPVTRRRDREPSFEKATCTSRCALTELCSRACDSTR